MLFSDIDSGLVAREPITLSALEFDVLWEHLRLESMPLAIKVPSPGKTYTERAMLARKAWEEIERKGLGRPAGLDPTLEELLGLLSRPDREVDGRVWLGRSVRVVAAGREEHGVLAVLDGERITLRPASGYGLPREAVSVLPPLPAGPGHSVTLRSAYLDAAAKSAADAPERLAAGLRERGIRAEDAQTLAKIVTGAGGLGQFGVAARDKLGRRQRGDRVIGFFDTPQGRYLQLRRSSAGGEPWSTIAPTDTRRIITHLAELLGELIPH